MSPVRLDIVTAERTVFSDDVDVVIAPGTEGELGILPHHTPLMTVLKVGELRARTGGDEISTIVSGGFLEVRPDKVIALVDTAERAQEVDITRAEEAKRRAEERLNQHTADVEMVRAEAALVRATMRLKIAKRRRKRQ